MKVAPLVKMLICNFDTFSLTRFITGFLMVSSVVIS